MGEDLRAFTAKPSVRLRVLTTSYLGATDLKAVDLLESLPYTEVRVSYDTHRTRLHAKAYLFHRDTDFGTAYVGSANLAHPALTEGLEWTVKLSQYESPHLWDRLVATFETYWEDREFEPYHQAERPKQLRRNNQPRPEAVVLGRPPEGAVYVRLPPLGAWSWSGPGFSQAPAEASPLMTNSRLIQCHARVLPSPDQNGKSTPDRSKLFGSHGQRPWF